MVEQSDRAPLLDWEEIPPPDPNQAARPPEEKGITEAEKGLQPAGRHHLQPATAVSTAVTYSPTRNRTAVVVSRDRSLQPARVSGFGFDRNLPFPCLPPRDQWEEKDQIVAVFVVTFGTRSGKKSEFVSRCMR